MQRFYPPNPPFVSPFSPFCTPQLVEDEVVGRLATAQLAAQRVPPAVVPQEQPGGPCAAPSYLPASLAVQHAAAYALPLHPLAISGLSQGSRWRGYASRLTLLPDCCEAALCALVILDRLVTAPSCAARRYLCLALALKSRIKAI